MNLSDRIHDRTVRDTLQVLRYEAGLSRRVLAHLRGLERDLKAALADAGDIRTKKRLNALLKEAQEAIQDRYTGAQGVYDEEAPQFVSAQAETMRATLNGLVKVDIFRHSLTTEQIQAIASDTLITGAPSAEWWADQTGDTLTKFTRIVRMGMLQGQTGDEMAREVRDMMGTRMRNAQALVRTSVITTNNAAHMALYEANADVLKGVQWSATLDTRTCQECGALDGQTWEMGDKHPMPSLHFGCRCTLLPVTKSFEELTGIKGLDDIPESTRASMNGQVASSMTYLDWLGRQDAATKADILGPGRARLLEAGKISLSDLVDQRGNELTLGQIKAAM